MPLVGAGWTGGSPITSYNLQYDRGAAKGSAAPAAQNFLSLVGEVPDNNIATRELTLSGLATDTVYSFRYRVRNKHGWSDFSDITGILTATAPAGMAAPSFSIENGSPKSVTLAWAAPFDGGDAIKRYKILVQHGDDSSTFSQELRYCDGSALATFAARSCTIPLTALRAAPFGLALNQLIVATIAAANDVGEGPASPVNVVGVRIQTEPQAPATRPAAVTYDESSVTIQITPQTGLDAGNSAVLYYALSWDRGLSQTQWSLYTVVASSTTLVTVRGLTSGNLYSFRYRAQNLHGWAPAYSSVLTVTAMTVPGKIRVPVTTSMAGATVLVEWEAPFTGGQGIPLVSYTVQLGDRLGLLAEYKLLCDGSNADVLDSRRCEVPMAAVTSSPSHDAGGANTGGLGLVAGERIVARVSATNAKGTGPFSEMNTAGMLAQVVPSAPLSAPYRGPDTTEARLDVHWAFLTDARADGGSAILNYGLEVDDGAGGAFYAVVGGSPATAPYTLNSVLYTTAVRSGATYRLRYRAYNVHGWGPYSPTGSVLAATVPDAPLEPALQMAGTSVQIDWSAPASTGGVGVAITAYKVELLLGDGTYKEDKEDCDGSIPSVVAAQSCQIPMRVLTSQDSSTGFGFNAGDEVQARITARNDVGEGAAGPLSTSQTVLAATVPATPSRPPRRAAGTNQA
jgi:hypothetical protein